MFDPEEVVIKVNKKTGEVIAEGFGFEGSTCEEVIKALLHDLGITIHRERKEHDHEIEENLYA